MGEGLLWLVLFNYPPHIYKNFQYRKLTRFYFDYIEKNLYINFQYNQFTFIPINSNFLIGHNPQQTTDRISVKDISPIKNKIKCYESLKLWNINMII